MVRLNREVLGKFGQNINAETNLDHLLKSILKILSEHSAMKRSVIVLLSNGDRLKICASYGLTLEEEKAIHDLARKIIDLIFSNGQSFILSGRSGQPVLFSQSEFDLVKRQDIYLIGAPIVLNGIPFGLLFVDQLLDGVSYRQQADILVFLAGVIAHLIAFDFKTKDSEQTLRRSLACLKIADREELQDFFKFGKSSALGETQELIKKVASTQAPVLLVGEPGTGKTLVARIIHELSLRSEFPFVKVNMGTPESLLELQLFGCNSADRGMQEGWAEKANGGTIFLANIDKLSLSLQPKILRFIQDHEFEKVGETETKRSDIRFLASTDIDLSSATKKGLFREDLYYRLSVFPIMLRPLRERKEDIAALVNMFSQRIMRNYGRGLEFTPAAISALERHSWPGNIRELENLLIRLAITTEGEIVNANNLHPYLNYVNKKLVKESSQFLSILREIEKSEIIAALERNNRVQSRAADELGITLRQMGYRIKKFGLEDFISQKKQNIQEKKF